MDELYLGVDVGTESVRGALVDGWGRVRRIAKRKVDIWNPKHGFYMQSSDDIWQAVCQVVQDITHEDEPLIRGVGFTATCSLVALSKDASPMKVYPSGEDRFNVIMWLDHRAEEEAENINATRHPVLDSFGGRMSLENQPPKLLWLKRVRTGPFYRKPISITFDRQEMGLDWWARVGHFFDLADFLTWKACGSLSRSLCTVVCKWGYRAQGDSSHGWDRSFWDAVGLGDLMDDECQKIGRMVLAPGTRCPAQEVATQERAFAGKPIATSLIDAHCGGVGLLGSRSEKEDLTSRLALICGTSTCHMAISEKPLNVRGVWGPYYSAMVPGLWLSEGGQSASGKLLDHIVNTHPASKNLVSQDIHTELGKVLEGLCTVKKVANMCELTADLHLWPDFHGNRSPIADPSLKGMISGLTLSTDSESLALLFLATIQSLAYGTRHVTEAMTEAGHRFSSISVCGGLSKNEIFVQTLADVMGLPVRVPDEPESVLVGAAVLGACAAGDFPNITEAMNSMASAAVTIQPNLQNAGYHEKKYKVFLKMLQDQLSYRQLMQ